MQRETPSGSSRPGEAEARRSERTQRRRQRVLDAAGQSFAARGFAKTTMDEIASRAGVSKGLLYSHFGDKEALLVRVMERTLDEWADVIRVQVEAANGAAGALAVLYRSSLQYARNNPLLRTLLAQDERVVLPGLDELTQRSQERFRAGLIDTLEQGIRSGELRPDLDVESMADVIRVFHGGFIDQLLRPGPVDVNTGVIEASVELMLHGLAKTAQT